MSGRNTRGGPHHGQEGGGRAHPYWMRPLSPGPPGGPSVPIFCYMKAFILEKNHKQAYETKLRRHEAEPWRNQSRALTELFCRGHFPLGGGNHRHRRHQRSSHQERAISINIFISTISSQTLVHLLYPILVSKPQIGTYGLLVVLLTPSS